MNENDYVEFSVLVDATIVVDRIDLDDSDNDLIYTDIDAKDLAIHNKYSLNVARIVIECGRQSAFEGFSRIVYEFHRDLYSTSDMEVVVGLEIPHETTPLTRTNEIDRLARMVESALAQMRESCGINATCGEMTTH